MKEDCEAQLRTCGIAPVQRCFCHAYDALGKAMREYSRWLAAGRKCDQNGTYSYTEVNDLRRKTVAVNPPLNPLPGLGGDDAEAEFGAAESPSPSLGRAGEGLAAWANRRDVIKRPGPRVPFETSAGSSVVAAWWQARAEVSKGNRGAQTEPRVPVGEPTDTAREPTRG